MTALLALGAVALLLLAPLLVTALRQRTLLTMALRNIRRRRTEAVLIVGGALLGTAIITSSFVVGDIIEGAVGDTARTQLGPIDITVTASHDGHLDDLAKAVQTAEVDGVDGLLATTTSAATLEAPGSRTALPQVTVAELDLEAARSFGSDPTITGVAGSPALRPGEILLNERSADTLAAEAGDTLRLHAYGGELKLTVVEVVPEIGLAGFGGAIVPPGTLASLTDAGGRSNGGATTDAAPPQARLLVSLTGGVFDTRELSGPAASAISEAVRHLPGTQVDQTKATLLDDAEHNGSAFTELFAGIGVFSVLAGVLLLVNLFVMMAEERKTELGMLRALGFTRRRLTRAFAIEGAIYATIAAAVGAVAGIGIGWLVALATSTLGLLDQAGAFRLVVEPASVGTGAATGLIISLLTIWATSRRISRLNVIRAIRDLPEPRLERTRTSTLVLGSLGVLAGAALSGTGYLDENALSFLIGVPVAAFSATPLLRRLLPERTARLASAATVLGWGLVAYPLFPSIMSHSEVSIFVVQTLVVTAGAIAASANLDRVWAYVVDRWSRGGRGLAVRLGVVYPLARRLRTAMLLSMFTLVILTITLISAFSVTVERNTDRMVDQAAAGFDVLLDTSPSNPVERDRLLARDDVAAVAPLIRGLATIGSEHLDASRTRMLTAVDADLLTFEAPGLVQRDDVYATDADAYRAVLADPSLAIVPEGYLDVGGADSTVTPLTIGDTLTLASPAGDGSREVTIVGLRDFDWTGNGAMVNREVTEVLLGAQAVASRWYVAGTDGSDPDVLASALDVGLVTNGADATSFTTLGADAMSEDQGSMLLVRAFLGLGLLIGIAGMGVVMIRAVRERRQAIGVLRAMGLRAGLVRTALLSEAGFIAVQGTVIGVVLGLISARQLLTNGGVVVDADVVFAVPWLALVVIVAVPLAAVLAATAWPASRAATTRPAIALRTID